MRELGLVEHLHGEIERQRGEHLRRRIGRQIAQRFGDVGGAHAGERLRELLRVTVQEVEQLGNRWTEARGCSRHDVGIGAPATWLACGME